MAEGKGDGRSPANEYGNEGGGGGGATGMGESSVDLSEFLPGGKKDPTKNKTQKGWAALPLLLLILTSSPRVAICSATFRNACTSCVT